MEPVIDINKEYGLVFDGGGARGAYQIGAWKALVEAGVKINAIAGTSVGALNGALVCMGDVSQAERIWNEMTFSSVMDVDDDLLERFFDGEASIRECLKDLWQRLTEGGIDITPLKKLIHDAVDEEKIRRCGKEFCLLTFSVSDLKELDLSLTDIPEGLLEDFLLASAYLLGFKNEPLHGKTYIDGGVFNNVPVNSLVKRGYSNIIQVRIYGPGRVPRVTIPEDGCNYVVSPRVSLGSILEFSGKRSRQNLKIGYFDAKRMLYGLEGSIYYIEETKEECYYEKIMGYISEFMKAEYRIALHLSVGCSDKELFFGMLEAGAKLMRIPKYRIYTVDELWSEVCEAYEELPFEELEEMPKFVHTITGIRNGRGTMKAEILKMLRETEGYLSGQELCDRFQVSRTAVWKVINQLKEEGYGIEAVRNKGYSIVEYPDLVTEEEIASHLTTKWAGQSLKYYDVTDSTNTRAKALGENGAVHGTLVVAEQQDAGKGRRGKSWSSPPGTSIYMTLLLRPEIDPSKAPMLTLVMAYSAAQALREKEQITAKIKWPNDLVLHKKKICGILTEMSAEVDYINYVVIGVGINVNMQTFPEEIMQTATSLRIETGETFQRAELIAGVMEKFEQNYEQFMETEDLTLIQDAYNAILVNQGRMVKVLEPDGGYDAKALGINEKGELLVEKEDGSRENIYAGEVSVRGIYGYV